MKKFILHLIIFSFIALNLNYAQRPPISPKWVFEPWVWEDQTNTEDAANTLINKYKNDYNIPVGAIIIDSPWEAQYTGSSYDENNNNGYNTFIFNQTWYNNPHEFVHNLNTQGIYVILWITGLIDEKCGLYGDAKKDSFFVNNGDTYSWWKGSGRASLIDFFNPDAVHYWEGLMDQILDSYEISGWKVDESDNELPDGSTVHTSQGDKTKQEYSNAYYSEMYTYIHNKKLSDGMIMARPYCDQSGPYSYVARFFAPIDVNTAGWVGDQQHTWNDCGLDRAIKSIFVSADAGYAAVGSDIGGGGYSERLPKIKIYLFVGCN